MQHNLQEPVIVSETAPSPPEHVTSLPQYAHRPPAVLAHTAAFPPLSPLQQQQLQLRLQLRQRQQQLQERILLRQPLQQPLPQPPAPRPYQMNPNTHPAAGIDAPAAFFAQTPIDDASIGIATPQIDTTDMAITPSLLDPVGGAAGSAPMAGAVPQISPIVEEPSSSSSIIQPSKTTIDNAGILTLLKPIRSKPKTKTAPKSKPAFVMKLWSMVNDASNQDLISWLPDGESLVISHRESFVREILPKYFKHSNFASFVRQLNMYGWHKVQDPSSGAMHSDERWQFANPNFQRDHPELLDKIVRNKPQEENDFNSNTHGAKGIAPFDISLLISELNTLKSNQMKITQELSRVRQDNDLLWQELYQTRERNMVQNDKVEKILQFLSSVYGNGKVPVLEDQMNGGSQLQPYTPSDYTSAPTEPSFPPQSYNKPRLMIKQHRHVSNSSSTTSTTPNTNGVYEIDNSPVQEIVRTPAATIQPDYPQQYMNSELDRAQEDELYQSQIPTNMAPPMVTHQELQTSSNTAQSKMPFRPSLQSTPSLDELSKTIEQQGHSLNDIITRLQHNQYEQAPTFDLDDFLNEEVPDGNGSSSETTTGTNSTPKVSIQEVQDDDLKRGMDDDEAVEEIINPSKKRKSGNY